MLKLPDGGINMAKVRSVKTQAIDEALKAMVKDLEARPVPNTLKSVADQLSAGENQPAPRRGRRRG